MTLVERTADGGRKILISGGGRCNVLPSTAAPEQFVSDSPPPLVRGAARRLAAARAAAVLRGRRCGIPLALEAGSGKLFPASNRARDVRDGLVARAARARASGCDSARRSPQVERRRRRRGPVAARRTASSARRAVIVATGGLSVPTTGSDGFGLALARALGHAVQPTYAALTPLTTEPGRACGAGRRVARRAARRARRPASAPDRRGGFLFTHRGYSGPAVLDVSHVAVRSQWPGADARDGARGMDGDGRGRLAQRMLAGARGRVATAVGRHLPQRLADMLVREAGVARRPHLRAAATRRADRGCCGRSRRTMLPWTGDEGYRTAEVTGGGVALDEVHRGTLESRARPGLFFCGEVLDAFGPIGGHNFSWAWSTGRTAGPRRREDGLTRARAGSPHGGRFTPPRRTLERPPERAAKNSRRSPARLHARTVGGRRAGLD